MPDEAWRSLKPGDRVRVVNAIDETTRWIMEQHATVVFELSQFTKPHGFAVCCAETDIGVTVPIYIHPEMLEKVSS